MSAAEIVMTVICVALCSVAAAALAYAWSTTRLRGIYAELDIPFTDEEKYEADLDAHRQWLKIQEAIGMDTSLTHQRIADLTADHEVKHFNADEALRRWAK